MAMNAALTEAATMIRSSATADSRQGVKHHAASGATTYTTDHRRGCRLRVPSRLLDNRAGTMTKAEYDAWEEGR